MNMKYGNWSDYDMKDLLFVICVSLILVFLVSVLWIQLDLFQWISDLPDWAKFIILFW